jgi:surface protein
MFRINKSRTSSYGKQVPTLHRTLGGGLNGGGGLDPDVFRTRWNTENLSAGSSNDDQVMLPLPSGGTYDMIVDWGDGSDDHITAWDDAEVTHTYTTAGIYDVTITGQCDGWRFVATGDKLKLVEVSNWGLLKPISTSTFYGCSNADFTATDLLDTSLMNSYHSMFRDCTLFNMPIDNWDVTGITVFTHMFYNCTSFNQPLSGWDVSNSTTWISTFQNTAFNQDIGDWDVTAVGSFSTLFGGCDFDQDLSAWRFKSVGVQFPSMFGSSDFSGIGGVADWNTEGVTNLSGTFSLCPFNQPLNTWDTSAVTLFGSCFYLNTVFNQDLDLWDVSQCASFDGMFQYASAFNGDVTGWTLGTYAALGGISTSHMFRASSFNQDLSSWDWTSIDSMSFTFYQCTAFDQDVSGWDTVNVTNMGSCFRNCTALDPDCSTWDITALTYAATMMVSSAHSQTEYDKLLIGWEAGTHNNTVSYGTSAPYTTGGAAETARTTLDTTDSWTIADGGPA